VRAMRLVDLGCAARRTSSRASGLVL
jgi:hypothetical protein